MTRPLNLLLAPLIFLLTVGAANAQTDIFAGYVVSYQSRADTYEILHGGKPAVTGYYAKVFAGDVVRIKQPNVVVHLDFSDTTSASVSASNSPYTVPTPRQPFQASIHNVVAELGRFLTREQENEFTAIGRDRSPDQSGPLTLSIPGVADGTARIAAGERIFGVAWRGGTAPFVVAVQDDQGKQIIHEDDVDGHELIKGSRKITLAPGVYALSLRDAVGAQAAGHFTVVAADAIPAPQANLIPDFLDPAAKSVMSASWILRYQPKTYWYEAYLEVLPFTFGDRVSDDGNLIDWSVRHPAP